MEREEIQKNEKANEVDGVTELDDNSLEEASGGIYELEQAGDTINTNCHGC